MSKFNIEYGETLVIPIDNIRINLGNTRQKKNDEKLQELVESIKGVGVIEPVIVMETDDLGFYELICGWRRFEASQLAGMDDIIGRVAICDIEGAKLLQVIENCQREDIEPLEERDAFNEWIRAGNTASDIALKIGKSDRYVHSRLNLNKLIAEVEAVFSEGKITITTALEFCKLIPKRQAELLQLITQRTFDNNMDIVVYSNDTREIRKYINEISTDLKTAVFDTSSDRYDQIACVDCVKRSGCMKTLFADIVDDDICFDKDCYGAKVNLHITQSIAFLRESGKNVVTLSNSHFSNKAAQEAGFDYSFYKVTMEPVAELDLLHGTDYGVLDGSELFRIISFEEDSAPNNVTKGVANTLEKTTRSAPLNKEGKARREVANKITTSITECMVTMDPPIIPFTMLQWLGWEQFKQLDIEAQKNFAKQFGLSGKYDGKKISWKDLTEENTQVREDLYFQGTGKWNEKATDQMVTLINTATLFNLTNEWEWANDLSPRTETIKGLTELFNIDTAEIVGEVENEYSVAL